MLSLPPRLPPRFKSDLPAFRHHNILPLHPAQQLVLHAIWYSYSYRPVVIAVSLSEPSLFYRAPSTTFQSPRLSSLRYLVSPHLDVAASTSPHAVRHHIARPNACLRAPEPPSSNEPTPRPSAVREWRPHSLRACAAAREQASEPTSPPPTIVAKAAPTARAPVPLAEQPRLLRFNISQIPPWICSSKIPMPRKPP